MVESKKQTVYAMNHGRVRFACQYYRIDVPCQGLKELGLASTWNDKLEHGQDESVMSMATSDFDLFWGIGGEAVLGQLSVIKNMKPMLVDGRVEMPPTLILDTDDNRDYIHPHSTAYCSGGVRTYPDNKLLNVGDTVISPDETSGKMVTLWEDKKTSYGGVTFDIARNLKDMEIRHKLQRLVHGMTVSSPYLVSYLKNVIGVKHVHFFPNTVIPEHYKSYKLVRETSDIRILWQGGSSHLIDWWPLRHAIKEICQKYTNIKFIIFGQLDEWMVDYIPPSYVEHVPWVDYAAYKLQRGLLQIDINLCPLADNAFNRCKSAIKWYEGSVWDEPEATLASKAPPYGEEIVDNETALLYSTPAEFVQKLSLLIEDANLRKRLGAESKKWIMQNRTIQQTIPPLWEFYQELLRERIGKFLLAQR